MADKLYTDELISKTQAVERNLLINGNFDFWQRSLGPVSFNTTVDYVATDRWLHRSQGAGTSCTVERDPDTNVLGHMMLMKVLNTNTTYVNTFQRVESRYIEPLVGENVYWGVWVWQATGSALDIDMNAYTPNSTADNWSTDFLDLTYIGAKTTNVPSGEWTWVDYSFTVPADGKNGLMVGFQTDAITTVSSIWLKNAVLHRGTQKLPDYLIHTRTDEEEFAMCQRYYQKTYNRNTTPGSTNNSGRQETRVDGTNYAPTMIQFPVSMFSDPTITLYDNAGNSGAVTVEGTNSISASAGYIGVNGFGFMSFTGQSVGDYVDFHYTAAAEI